MSFLPGASLTKRGWLAISLALITLLLLSGCRPAGVVESGATASAVATESNAQPAPAQDWRGFPVGFTAEGYPYRGSPQAAVTLTFFGAYPSAQVARFQAEQLHDVEESYVRRGQVRLVYRHYPMSNLFSLALPAAQAAECAADQGAAFFWRYHDELYRRQIWWTQDPDPLARFQELAAELGLDSEEFAACLAAGEDVARIRADAAAAREAGIVGVPSLSVDQWVLAGATDLGRLQDLFEAALAGQPRPPEPTPAGPNGGILVADSTRPGYTLLGDAYRGNLEAPAGFILFDDPQSAAQAALAYRRDVVEPIFETFVEGGRIWVLYRHMTEAGDFNAQRAGEAMECAGRQQAFWAMRDWLLANQPAWIDLEEPTAVFSQAAGTLGLAGEDFDACLASDRTSFKVRQDRSQAFDSQFRQAPALILFSQGEPRVINRNLPYEAVAQLVEAALAAETMSPP